ncbi:hypothetical protein [Acidithiobacillus ferriphilus]|uniref:Uncharacterized protein n=1 Tax=Acidithiobacillus ferriphilus TaxID=1689834 RepID=A0ABU6FP06_9PROT|nr:hypothetical protein [Acidithiobacillus ferriphilus]MEB8513247.1 hypothetical protein [Acidithiobacillus ferriphilus]
MKSDKLCLVSAPERGKVRYGLGDELNAFHGLLPIWAIQGGG